MKNKERTFRQEIIKYIMNAVIVILCIILLIVIYQTVDEYNYYFTMPNKERSFANDVYAEDYASMVYAYYENTAEGFKGNAKMKEYYGVAKYFEAASFYKVYLETGDMTRVEKQEKKMEEAYEEMGEWSILQEEIDARLGIQ